VSLGEAKKRIKELTGELKAVTAERDQAIASATTAAAAANSGGNGGNSGAATPAAGSSSSPPPYSSSVSSPIVPGLNRRSSNNLDNDFPDEETRPRRTSAAASLFREVDNDSSDEDFEQVLCTSRFFFD